MQNGGQKETLILCITLFSVIFRDLILDRLRSFNSETEILVKQRHVLKYRVANSKCIATSEVKFETLVTSS